MQAIIEQITPDIKVLIFDLDGTLADTLPLHLQAWEEAGSQLGLNVTREMILDHSGTPTVKVAEILGREYQWNIDPQTISSKKFEKYEKIKLSHGKIKAIQPMLDIAKLYYKKLPMSIGTGSRRDAAISALKDIEALHLFDIIVTATDVSKPKPHPETFLKSAEYFGVKPENCIVFEDGAAGIKAAKAAGMKLIDVRNYL